MDRVARNAMAPRVEAKAGFHRMLDHDPYLDQIAALDALGELDAGKRHLGQVELDASGHHGCAFGERDDERVGRADVRIRLRECAPRIGEEARKAEEAATIHSGQRIVLSDALQYDLPGAPE